MQPVRTPGGGHRPSQGGPQVGGGGYAWECTGELSPQHNPPKSAHSTFTSVAFHEVDNNGTFTRSVADVTLKSNNIRIDIATNAKKKSCRSSPFFLQEAGLGRSSRSFAKKIVIPKKNRSLCSSSSSSFSNTSSLDHRSQHYHPHHHPGKQ